MLETCKLQWMLGMDKFSPNLLGVEPRVKFVALTCSADGQNMHKLWPSPSPLALRALDKDPLGRNAKGILGLQKWLPNYDRVSEHTEEWSELFLRGGGSITLVSNSFHYCSQNGIRGSHINFFLMNFNHHTQTLS